MALAGKVVLITGASKGIGKAATLHLASQGANVVINYNRDSESANAMVHQIGPDRALAVQADASNLSDLDRLVEATVSKFGKIDVVIPNAGILPMKDLESTTEEDFDNTFNLLVKGPYFLVQKAVKHMPSGGRVVLISTSLTVSSSIAPAYLLYTSAKGAIEQMTRVMAKDLGRKGICVNAVAPGPTTTELFLEGKSEQLLKSIAGNSPFNRIAKPDEIVGTIAFLCGEGSNWVSGQVVRVNGAIA